MASSNFNRVTVPDDQAHRLAQEMFRSIEKHEPVSRIASYVKQGADLEARFGGLGETALLRAILCRQNETALFLIDSGANINAPGLAETVNPLIYSCMFGDYDDVTEKLLDKGVPPDTLPARGTKTALMQAADGGKWGRARLLIRRGASIYLRDEKGKTAVDYAQEQHGHSAAKKLVDLYDEIHAHDPIKVMKTLSLKKPVTPRPSPEPTAGPVIIVAVPAKPAKKTREPKA